MRLLNVLKTLARTSTRGDSLSCSVAAAIAIGRSGRSWQTSSDQNADHGIITSDNPRKEDPEAIMAEVEKGFRRINYEKIVDRTQAIARAIALAQPRDIVLIAGKGHENYQEFADHTVPFDDIQVARRALENRPVEF